MDGAWAPAPRGMPHPQSDFAKRINKLAAASPVSTKLRDHLVALARKRGLDLIHNQLPGLDLVALGPNGVRIYDGFVGRDQYVVKGTTSLRGTVSDLLGQLRHQTASTHDCRRSFYQLFLRTFTHSINLKQADDVSTVGSDAIQVHWLALRGDGVHATPFDMVFASHSQQYVWDRVAWRPWTPLDGSQVMREAATHVWESIDTRTLPAFDDASTGCARLKVHHSGFVIEKSPDVANHCVVSFVLCFNDRELSRPWMQELVGGLPRFCGRDHFLVIPTQLWSYNAYCHLCFKTFRLYRRRHHCRLCGHATCSSCSHNVEIDVASDIEASFVRQTPVLTCHRCSCTMSTLSQWAEDDDANEDDNILWDESTEEKLAENRGGFHLRKQNSQGGGLRTIPLCKTPPATDPRLITMSPPTASTLTTRLAPPAPVQGLLKKKDAKKASKFGLGERPLGSPSNAPSGAQTVKLNGSFGGGAKRRSTKTKSGDIGSASSGGGSVSNSAALKMSETPEQVRRFLLAEVKQMSIERLVADAKRYLYLEDFHQKHTATSYVSSSIILGIFNP
ncbi:hypothetical protein DYB28_011389 [Aphanomyces astaci]|uniref:FYVE-type domain-containing protein n=1 Tax=Aphanomyces astaci TaxID=112090 RepID=A0A9X8H2L2_APHAT|nr:hypothetical protein DYB28_011389 [Aphanomyces astaci]